MVSSGGRPPTWLAGGDPRVVARGWLLYGARGKHLYPRLPAAKQHLTHPYMGTETCQTCPWTRAATWARPAAGAHRAPRSAASLPASRAGVAAVALLQAGGCAAAAQGRRQPAGMGRLRGRCGQAQGEGPCFTCLRAGQKLDIEVQQRHRLAHLAAKGAACRMADGGRKEAEEEGGRQGLRTPPSRKGFGPPPQANTSSTSACFCWQEASLTAHPQTRTARWAARGAGRTPHRWSRAPRAPKS